MNRFVSFSSTFLVLMGAVSSAPAAFNNGDLVILTTASNTGDDASVVALNNYAYDAVTGTFSTSPTVHAISGLTLPGDSDHEGMLHLSTDGKYLVFGGFQAASGTADVIASSAPRGIGVVDSNWNQSTITISGFTGVDLRSVVSTDNQHFWAGGDDEGQYYIDASGGPITQTLVVADDIRANRIVDGQLWGFNSGNGGTTIGSGLPTSSSTSTIVMTGPVKSDGIFLDLDTDGISETAYTTDGKNLLGKWYFDGTAWTVKQTWAGDKNSIDDINSLEAFLYNGNVELLAATQAGQLFQFTDTNGMNLGFGGSDFATTTPTPYLTLAAGSFRGMAILTAVPEPSTLTLLALALSGFAIGRRRRARRCAS